MPPSPGTLQNIQAAINLMLGMIALLTAVVGWIAWVVRKTVPSRAEHQRLAAKVEEVAGEIEGVKALAKAMPTQRELHELQLQMERFNGNTRVLNAQLEGARELQAQTRVLVGVMHEHLMNVGVRP